MKPFCGKKHRFGGSLEEDGSSLPTMDDSTNPRADIDRLLTLIGMLGDPADSGFWDTWRTELDGYAFKKMKGGIAQAARLDTSPVLLESFAGYVLKFFSTSSPEREEALVESVGAYLSGHSEDQLAVQFLTDIRSTAWRVYRHHSGVDPQKVASWWAQAEL